MSDQSSMFLSRPCNVSDYGLIWAGVQKNVGPAGMAVVIIREDLLREDLPQFVPTYMSYKTHADNDSLYNTPQLLGHLLLRQGLQVPAGKRRTGGHEQAQRGKGRGAVRFPGPEQVLHRCCPQGGPFPDERPLRHRHKDLDAAVVAASKEAGFDNLKGHKSVGGLRASIYNAMPKEGVEALVEFLKKYEAEHA